MKKSHLIKISFSSKNKVLIISFPEGCVGKVQKVGYSVFIFVCVRDSTANLMKVLYPIPQKYIYANT